MRRPRPLPPLIALAALLPACLPISSKAQARLGSSPYILHITGKVVDVEDKSLGDAFIAIDTNGVKVAELYADAKGRFAFDLDIGGFYGISVQREGFVRKRFIVDARTDEPEDVITGPFSAEVTLMLESAFAEMDITDLYYPYALIFYSKKDRAFIADPEYIAERQRVEAALKLGAARMRKKQGR